MSYRSPLRDLIQKIDQAASGHLAYGQAATIIQNCKNHLSALARIEELNHASNSSKIATDQMAG